MMHAALNAITQRVSSNHFDPAFSIGDATIREQISYASQAPSAYNLRNWRFIAVRSPERKLGLMALACGQEKVANAAVTFIVRGVLDRTPNRTYCRYWIPTNPRYP